MIDFPLASNAAAQALCIELLEVGAWMAPLKDEGFIVTITVLVLFFLTDPKKLFL
jgi:hypothetical protein